MEKEYLFEGPGLYGIIPQKPLRITNPKCENKGFSPPIWFSEKDKKEFYAWNEKHPCLCISNRMNIPRGWYYTVKEDGHVCELRPKYYKADNGLEYTFGPSW